MSLAPSLVSAPEGRSVCPRCERPAAVCYCESVAPVATRTRVVLVQHPREKRVPVGTARMAHLSLPNSVLRVGLDFAADPVITRELQRGPNYVLFPKPGAIPAGELPRDQPATIVAVDGTWWQAQKLLKLNPQLAGLPAVTFTPRTLSQYQIRRQPADYCLSTIEALAELLDVLEPGKDAFERLLQPFRAMVRMQERFRTEVGARRHQLAADRRNAAKKPSFGARLAVDWERLVCVQGEANAWPCRHPEREPPEIVHWVAYRPATGERYEAVIAPRHRLAPSTPLHVLLPAETLAQGCSVEAWRHSWQGFLRPNDKVVQWGMFFSGLAAEEGLAMPGEWVDLRAAVAQLPQGRSGMVEDLGVRMGVEEQALGIGGRAGRRLAALVSVLRGLCGIPAAALEP